MISMVDSDGDGQVSYEEFHRLIIDPDPSRADFGTEAVRNDAKEAAQVSQASVNVIGNQFTRRMTTPLPVCAAGGGGEGQSTLIPSA